MTASEQIDRLDWVAMYSPKANPIFSSEVRENA
jgi:hypothetical protein